ncbi:MAG: sulfatase-like hydrolase/transferase, partial [Planctomycetota bacterium]
PSLADPSLYAFRRYQMLFHHEDKPELYRQWLQAYMACVAFIDDQAGTVLDALEASDYADNTVVILTSDHGFHVGDKEAIYKQTLWDSGTRIPFIVAGLEGMPMGIACDQPISLIDVYPTFIDLCRLPKNPHSGRSDYPLDGHSIKPLLFDPKGTWSGPAVAITALPGKDHSQHREHLGTLYPHFSVRSRDWRYSLTSDGQEELYRYPTDPYEFTNLAEDPAFEKMKSELRSELIRLRDGDSWMRLDELPPAEIAAFELIAEVKGKATWKLGRQVVAESASSDWTSIRLRVAGKRSQLWLDHRVASDKTFPADVRAGELTTAGAKLRRIRLREL